MDTTVKTALPRRSAQAILNDVERLEAVQLHAAELAEEIADIKSRLLADYRDDLGTHQIGANHKVTITAPKRWDADLARTVLPPALISMCEVTTLSGSLAKATLPPALYDQCRAPGAQQISVS